MLKVGDVVFSAGAYEVKTNISPIHAYSEGPSGSSRRSQSFEYQANRNEKESSKELTSPNETNTTKMFMLAPKEETLKAPVWQASSSQDVLLVYANSQIEARQAAVKRFAIPCGVPTAKCPYISSAMVPCVEMGPVPESSAKPPGTVMTFDEWGKEVRKGQPGLIFIDEGHPSYWDKHWKERNKWGQKRPPVQEAEEEKTPLLLPYHKNCNREQKVTDRNDAVQTDLVQQDYDAMQQKPKNIYDTLKAIADRLGVKSPYRGISGGNSIITTIHPLPLNDLVDSIKNKVQPRLSKGYRKHVRRLKAANRKTMSRH